MRTTYYLVTKTFTKTFTLTLQPRIISSIIHCLAFLTGFQHDPAALRRDGCAEVLVGFVILQPCLGLGCWFLQDCKTSF